MLKQNTVFILGAAVSHELDLPLGSALKDQIYAAVPGVLDSGGDPALVEVAERIVGTDLYRAGEALRRGLPLAVSIDNLVEHYKDDAAVVKLAKLAIAFCILRAEFRSHLFEHKPDIFNKPQKLWSTSYGAIFQQIVSNVPRNRIEQALSRVTFINFNYDRCLERFLYKALVHHSGLSHDEAVQALAQVTIYHPYGYLGSLERGEQGVPAYGDPAIPPHLAAAAERIRTFSEEIDSQHAKRIRRAFSTAEQVIMLGCAGHDQNLQLLNPRGAGLNAKAFYGTVFLQPPDTDLIQPSLTAFAQPTRKTLQDALELWSDTGGARNLAPDKIQLETMTSRQMIAKYGASWRAKPGE